MASPLAHRWRTERSFDRVYTRHVGDVYRYALAILRDPGAAEEATRAVFVQALREHPATYSRRGTGVWFAAKAHDVCRARLLARRDDETGGGHTGAGAVEARAAGRSLTCAEAELALSRRLDGRLTRRERASLAAHVRACRECAALERRHLAQRAAIRTLTSVSVPSSLGSLSSIA